MKRLIIFIVGAWILLGSFALEAKPRRVYVKVAPPAPKVVVVKKGKKPHPKAVWVGGHWRWTGKNYVWKEGYWLKPRKKHVWVPGHWVKDDNGWYRVDGHWKKVK